MAPKGYKLSAESKAKITGRPISSNEPSTIYGWSKQLPKAATREQRQAAGRLGAAVRWGTLFYLAAMCCARYREKDETDLTWNRIRRQVTRDLDTRIQNFREELLNEMLTASWEKYVAAIETGSLVELEDEATRWVDDLLSRQLRPAIKAKNGRVAKA